MIIHRCLLIESDHVLSTWPIVSRHMFRWTAERAKLRRMALRRRQMIEPERRYGWRICPAVRVDRRSRRA